MKTILQSILALIIYLLLFLSLNDFSYYQQSLPLLLVLPSYFTKTIYSKIETILFFLSSFALTIVLLFLCEQDTIVFFIEKGAWLSFLLLFMFLFPFGRKQQEDSEQPKSFLDEIIPQQNIAGGLAHEFNNHLMVLFGNIELLRYSPTEKHATYFERLNKAFDLSTKYTSKMQ